MGLAPWESGWATAGSISNPSPAATVKIILCMVMAITSQQTFACPHQSKGWKNVGESFLEIASPGQISFDARISISDEVGDVRWGRVDGRRAGVPCFAKRGFDGIPGQRQPGEEGGVTSALPILGLAGGH